MGDLSYQDQVDQIGTLDSDALDALEQTVVAAFEQAEADDDIDAMASAADAVDQIRDRRTELASADNVAAQDVGTATDVAAVDAAPTEPAASEVAVPIAADGSKMPASLRERFEAKSKKGKKDKEPDGDEDDAVTAASTTEGETSPETPDTASDAVTAASTTEQEQAAVDQTDIPQDRQPLVASAVSTIVAGADIPGYTAGTEFSDPEAVAEAFIKRLSAVRGVRSGDGEKLIVASVQNSVDPDRELYHGADQDNYRKVDSVVRAMKEIGADPETLVASGGYCAPLETRYDIFGVGVADRPVRDSLAGFQATRGGIRYVQPPLLKDYSNAVGLWSAANDANPGSDGPSTKPFMTVVCQPELTATLDAITLEMQFGNLMTRAFPELVARNNELGLIYHARFAEQTLLTKISGLSTAVTSSFQLGFARDFLTAIGRAASAYRARHRMNPTDPLRVLVPIWVRDAIREDLSHALPGDNITVADAIIDAALAARHVNASWHLDDSNYTGVQSAGALNNFPTSFKWFIFAEGTFLFLDGGTLDLGIVRDSTLVNTNDYRMFVETFEGVAKVGIESIAVTTTTHVAGLVAGQLTVTGNA